MDGSPKPRYGWFTWCLFSADPMRKEYDFSKGKRGAVIPSPGKTRITTWLDDEILEHFRKLSESTGKGYQTLINDALRASMKPAKPLTAAAVRKIVREELAEHASRKARTDAKRVGSTKDADGKGR